MIPPINLSNDENRAQSGMKKLYSPYSLVSTCFSTIPPPRPARTPRKRRSLQDVSYLPRLTSSENRKPGSFRSLEQFRIFTKRKKFVGAGLAPPAVAAPLTFS